MLAMARMVFPPRALEARLADLESREGLVRAA